RTDIMIIDTAVALTYVSAFVAGLQAATRGTFRVAESDRGGLCTGWLITDSLLVLPFTTPGQTRFRCSSSADEGASGVAVDADLVFTPASGSSPYQPSLLRLHEAFPDRVLKLHTTSPRPGQPVLLVHYPLAVPQAKLSLGRIIGGEGSMVSHDANTEPGSGGAPVLDADGMAVLAM